MKLKIWIKKKEEAKRKLCHDDKKRTAGADGKGTPWG